MLLDRNDMHRGPGLVKRGDPQPRPTIGRYSRQKWWTRHLSYVQISAWCSKIEQILGSTRQPFDGQKIAGWLLDMQGVAPAIMTNLQSCMSLMNVIGLVRTQ